MASKNRRARRREEQIMRWMIFATIQLMALGSVAAVVIHGPSMWTTALSLPSFIVFWLVRHLFRAA